MNRELALEALLVLSKMESLLFTNKERVPDHIVDELCAVVEKLQKEVLK